MKSYKRWNQSITMESTLVVAQDWRGRETHHKGLLGFRECVLTVVVTRGIGFQHLPNCLPK